MGIKGQSELKEEEEEIDMRKLTAAIVLTSSAVANPFSARAQDNSHIVIGWFVAPRAAILVSANQKGGEGTSVFINFKVQVPGQVRWTFPCSLKIRGTTPDMHITRVLNGVRDILNNEDTFYIADLDPSTFDLMDILRESGFENCKINYWETEM